MCQSEDSIPRPQHYNDVQMEDQSPDTEIAFGLSNQARIEPMSPARQMHSPVRNSTPSSVQGTTRGFEQMVVGPSPSVGLATRPSVAAGNFLSTAASPQMLALGEIEFVRRFLIHVYLAE